MAVDKDDHLAALDAALTALERGEPCPSVPDLPDAQRDQFAASGMLSAWLTKRRETVAHIAGLPAPPRKATGYALWSALTREQIAKLDAKDAGRLQARGGEPIPEENPLLARLARQAGITVAAWFDLAGA